MRLSTAVLLSLATLASASHKALDLVGENPVAAFNEWLSVNPREYAANEDSEEWHSRYSTWLANAHHVLEHNARPDVSYWLEINHLADLSGEEYSGFFLGYDSSRKPEAKALQGAPGPGFLYADVEEHSLPKHVNWVKEGAVTDVKNQQQCGSCWAFSTTGAVEGINAIVTGDLAVLSEQELVDCDLSKDHGCEGGLMDFAFHFIKKNGGIDTEEDYPYKAAENQCDIDRENRHVVTIDDYQDVPPSSEKDLRKAVAHQPIAVAIQADQLDFQLYAGGVFDGDCGTDLDHGVLVVGYGSHHHNGTDMDYWLVKNSWGAAWGDHGYIKLSRGDKGDAGQCGLALSPSFPIKKHPNPPPTPPTPPTPEPSPPGPTPDPPGPPSPPGPEPAVECDDSTACPAGSTCCCMLDVFDTCFSWACCPMPDAVCCDDHMHCCPEGYTCDQDGRCETAAPGWAGVDATPLNNSLAWLDALKAELEGRGRHSVPQLRKLPAIPRRAAHSSTQF